MEGVTIFQGMGCRTTKMNITFFMGNGVLNTALKFFPQKPPYRLNESQKTSFGDTFSLISVVLLDLFQKKKKVSPVCTRTNQANFMGSKL